MGLVLIIIPILIIFICCSSLISSIICCSSLISGGSSFLGFEICKMMSLSGYIDIDGQGVDCGPNPNGPNYNNGHECDLNEECASGWCHDPSNVAFDIFAFGLFTPDKECRNRP
tara:strand:+ start:656 stop:997 length:342 start_codon:yes stop_codon:yes gene_type:complete